MIDGALLERFKDVENHELISILRGRGLVVCAFSADDVISNQCPDYLDDAPEELVDKAWQWLSDHEERVEDAMTDAGNRVIGWAFDPIAATDPESDEDDEAEESE